MLKPYDLLENILLDIENGIKKNINASVLSKKYGFSEGHLRRLFSFAFKQSIAAYIRSRTLAASLNDILESNANILDIAVEYGFVLFGPDIVCYGSVIPSYRYCTLPKIY